MYSSIIRKPCKCGCGKMPTTGYAGYNALCRPDLIEEKKNKLNLRQVAVFGIIDSKVDDLSGLFDDLDWTLSRIVRISNADENGIGLCFTCDKPEHWTAQQNGHYISRKHLGLRWMETNCKTQCKKCNEFKSGNLDEYKKRLQALQPGLPEWLMEQSRQVEKPSKYELKILLNELRQKLKMVELKLKK